MTKNVRLNADPHNSKILRQIQAEWQKKFAPARISLDALANLAMKLGLDEAKTTLMR